MSRQQIIFSIIITIASLIIGYFISYYASKHANDVLIKNLRDELAVINKSYDQLINNPNINTETKSYLQNRKAYLEDKILHIAELVTTY